MGQIDLTWEVYGLPTPETEFQFSPPRKWKFDFVWKAQNIAVEIEGGVWSRGRHTRGAGYIGDLEKYNEGTKLGWRVFRFTPQQLKKGEAQEFMKGVLK